MKKLLILLIIFSINLNTFSQCKKFMLNFHFENYEELNVHELFISDTVAHYINEGDTIMSIPVFQHCLESTCRTWNLPFFCAFSIRDFSKLDSILKNKTDNIIQEFDSTIINKNYLSIRLCNGFDSTTYDRYIEFSSDFNKIFEFAYILEQFEMNESSDCKYWIFYYLAMSHHHFDNDEFYIEEYKNWKILNNKK